MAISHMTEQVGRVLGERYRLLSPLGSGASAEVYLADDVRLRRRVAVKILHAALVDDERFLRRFRAEARAAAALSHPNIVAVFDWDGDEGPYLVTEYLRGGSLRSILDAGYRLSPSQALVVGLQTAQALDFAHRRGFVHRDIKPANLLFGADSRLRVADFGLARAVAEAAWTEPTGAVVGTARYASPEQARGGSLDGRSDIYSLVLMLIEAVTGDVPFAADTTIGTLMARVDQPVVVPDTLSALAPVLTQAGVVSPEERPDAATLIHQLKDAATHLPRPPPPPLAVPAGSHRLESQDDRTLIGPATTADVSALDEVDPPDGRVITAPLPVVGHTSDPSSDSTVVGQDHNATEARPDGRRDAGGHGGQPLRAGRRRLVPGWLTVILTVVVALVAGAAGTMFFQQASVPSHVVPAELIGAQVSDINQLIGEYGWRIEQREEFRDGTGAGEIVDTDPRPGTPLREGETLSLIVSLGPPLVDVPQDLAGLPQQAAEARLGELGFGVEIVPTASHDVAVGTVIGLEQGTEPQLPRGETVRLLVASGPPPVMVPNLEGRSFGEARSELEALGLDVDRERERNGQFWRDSVIRTEPGAGSEVEPGSTVTVVVSRDGLGRGNDDDDDDDDDDD